MNIIDITPEKKQSQEKLRLAAYCRVSSNSEDQLHSFAAQIRYYKEYEKTHPEYKLVDIYADEGITGTSAEKRDELNRMIHDCKKGLIDRVVVKSVSRLARNTQDLLMVIRTLKECNVSIYFEEQGIDTSHLNTELIVTLPGMSAQQESDSISGNMRWSYKKRMESGEFNTCKPPFGYDMVDGKLVINEAEAAVVRRVFDLYLSGHGMQTIVRILNDEGVQRRNSKRWHTFTISYILNNERYIGDALLQKKLTTETLPHKKIRNNGQLPKYYVESANEPIISKEVYEAAQRLQTLRKNEHSPTKTESPLSGTLRCAECGRTFRKQVTRGKTYWACSGRMADKSDCRYNRVSDKGVREAFSRVVWKLNRYNREILGVAISDLERINYAAQSTDIKIKEIDKQIADLASRNHVIAKLHTNGILSSADYSSQSNEINNNMAQLRLRRKKLLSENTTSQSIEETHDLMELIQDYEPTFTFDEKLFEQIVERVIVESNEQLTFELIGGLRFTETIEEKLRCRKE